MMAEDPRTSDATAGQREATTFRKLRTTRTFEEVVLQVREMLFEGALKPGERLPGERDLAVQLGIGRPTLREALRALESSGLIVLRKGKTGGAFIATPSANGVSGSMSDFFRFSRISVEQLFEVRSWMQAGLARAACERATQDDIEKLKANVKEGQRLARAGLDRQRIETNIEFHSILAEATRNPLAQAVTRGLTNALKVLVEEVGSYPVASFVEDRNRLVRAIEQRDPEAAELAMERILTSSKRMYSQLEAEYASRQPSVAGPGLGRLRSSSGA